MSSHTEVKTVLDDPVQFAGLLRQCADALEQGSEMTLTLEGQTFTFKPQGKLEVEYEIEKNKHELEFEISWREAA